MPDLTPTARADIQGMILSGYGHLPHTAYQFLQIHTVASAKVWLRQLIPAITTAQPWAIQPDGTKAKPEIAVNLAWSYDGLQAIGLSTASLNTFAREFIEGMVTPKRSALLGDTGSSAPAAWDVGGPNNPAIHLVLILHGLNREQIHQHLAELVPETAGVRAIATEYGTRSPHQKEHFGFHDAISQPQIEGTSDQPTAPENIIRTGEFILGYTNEYGLLPSPPTVPRHQDPADLLPDLAAPDATPEATALKDLGRHGTYLVYRKLAQDVAGFWQFMAQHGQDASGCPVASDMLLLAAKFVGRWPSGTPLVLAPTHDDPTIGDANQFHYLPEDAGGFACPVAAHIRRTNPRDSLDGDPAESFKTARRHRILRRGSNYGEPLFSLEALDHNTVPVDIVDDGQPRGLHFFGVNVNIERQFEFIQQTWSNNPKFNGLYNDKDPITGDNDGSGVMTIPRHPIRERINHMPRFVTVRGGGYFFLPSLTALQFLAMLV
jgi:Dyp-type peroxidase family